MTRAEFENRTKHFALEIIKLVKELPRTSISDVLGRQLLKSGTSVGANYRAACRARSRAEMIAKLGIVEEEADESLFWMELLVESGEVKESRIKPLHSDCNEILSMVVASIRTARKGYSNQVRERMSHESENLHS